MNKKRILVLAYMISPTRGSEFSVAWNYVKKMSRNNEMVVIYGISGAHMGNIDEMLEYSERSPLPNVRFVPVLPNKLANALNWFNRHDIFVYTFYWAYAVWQRLAYKKAQELVKQESFDLIHYVGPIGYREPGYLWKIDLPYIWGPIGGALNINPKLIDSLTFGGKIKLGVRAILNSIQLRCSLRVRQAIKRADLLLSATTENQKVFKQIYGVESIYNPENAIDKLYPLNTSKFETIAECVDLIFVGTLDSRKSVITILRSLLRMNNPNRVRLHVVGDGVLRSSLEQFCKDNNLSGSVVWHGNVSRERVSELMNSAHLHMITSVSEGNPTTIWEAMSVGLPTLSLDHCGMHDTICDECGFKIPIVSYDQIVADIATVIDDCVGDPELLRSKACGVLRCRERYTWERRVGFLEECYTLAVENFRTKKTKK